MHLPRISLLLLSSAALIPWFGLLGLLPGAAALALFSAELVEKQRGLRRIGIALPVIQIAVALIREHAAAFYHLSANSVRYYSLPLLALGAMQPALWPAIGLLLAVAPLVDYRRLQPQLSWPTFTGLYWLELAAYQMGLWRGGWQRKTLRPLLPRLIWRK